MGADGGRQLTAKHRNRAAGLRTSGMAGFGYRYDKRDERGQQIPGVSRDCASSPEKPAVADAYQRLLADESLSIAREWNAAGFTTARGGTWTSLRSAESCSGPPTRPSSNTPQAHGRGEILGRPRGNRSSTRPHGKPRARS